MKEISNKTLAILVLILAFVSFIGLLAERGGITGMAGINETANITITVTTDIQINASDGNIDFGPINNKGENLSELFRNGINGSNDNITIQNTGATTVDIDYYGAKNLFGTQNGTAITNINTSDQSFQIEVMNDGGCGNVTLWNDSTGVYSNVSIGNSSSIYDFIDDCQTDEEFTVGIYVYVPEYEQSGSKSSTLVFVATEH